MAWVIGWGLTAVAGASSSTPQAYEPLTIDRIFLRNEFNARGYSIACWGPQEGEYLRWKSAGNGRSGRDLMRVDCKSGKETLYVPAQRFLYSDFRAPLAVEQVQLNPQRSRLLLYANSRRVWRRNTRGDYWVLDLGAHQLRKLGGPEAPPSSLMFATFSPDGRHVAYVRQNNLYVEDTATGRIRALTQDGSDTIINGTTDWVYEEELSLRKAFAWSPDGARIAFWRFDTTGVGRMYLLNNLAGLYPKIITIPYPKAGTRNSEVRLGVVDVFGGRTVWARLPGDPRNHYPARILWHPSGTFFVVQYLNRLQNTNALYRVDAATGEVHLITQDTDPAWVEVCDDWRWLDPKGRYLLYRSERDGWAQLYRIDIRNGRWTKLTRAPMDVLAVVGVETNRWIYFMASPKNATQRYLYRIPWQGGRPQRVTPKDQPGVHSYNISPDGHWAIHRWSRFNMPPRIELIHLPEHKTVRVLEENAALRRKLKRLYPVETKFFQVQIEPGVVLDGWYMRPAHFDESKQYPVLVYVYGEPAAQTVLDQWRGQTGLWYRMLVEKGYVVLSVDNRGTPAPRGRAWRKYPYRRFGVVTPRDQAKALQALLKRWHWLDPKRVAVWGWSGGGTMTLNLMFQYPDLYHVGMSVAPVPNLRLYDTIYQERYMGMPDENPEGYRLGSPITHARNLKGDLLIVHGTADDNVHYEGVVELIDELICWNKQFSIMVYPNRRHSILERMNSRRHLFTLLTRFLVEHCPPGPREPSSSGEERTSCTSERSKSSTNR